jgi:hypothetical protein
MPPPIRINTFGGATPAIDDRLLADNAAAESINSWLFSGRIEPVHSLVPVHTLADPNALSVFRVPIGDPGIDNMVDSYWLEFDNQNVRVIRSPIVGQDDDGRYYWADGQYPKMLTGTQIMQINAKVLGAWSATVTYEVNQAVTSAGVTYVAIQAGINHPPATSPAFWIVKPTPIKLGVPPPHAAPVLTASGGVSTTNVTVTYTYTWVASNGEEGPPAPPASITNKLDAIYHLTLTAPNTTESDARQLTKTRIYRSVVSAQGVATFYFVAEIPITTLTYDDNHATATDAVIIANETLQSWFYFPPPADFQQLVPMANGMVAGFRNNEVWFCEPYYPHAWPVQYVIGVDAKVMGLGVYDQSLIILTQGQPYAATGVDPSAMALSKIQPLEPCTAMLSIVNTPTGVLYSSPNGLINITPSGAQNLTLKMLTKDQWNETMNLTSISAAILSQGYYAYSIATGGVFQVDAFQNETNLTGTGTAAFAIESFFGTRPGLYIALNDQRIAFTVLDPTPSEIQNVITDIFSGEILQIRDHVVYVVDIRQQKPYAAYRWRSKIFAFTYPLNLGAAKIYWTPPALPATAPPGATSADTVFRVFAGDTADQISSGLPLRFAQNLARNAQMFRLPSGYKAMYWQFEVEGAHIIDAIHVAQTPRELRQV